MPSVVITGADRGFGYSLCNEFLSRGWKVFAGKYLSDYQLLEELSAENDNLTILPMDMTSRKSIEAARGIVLSEIGTLDMIVSNAAMMGSPGDGHTVNLLNPPMAIDHVEKMFVTNAIGALVLTEVFLPLMEKSDMRRLCYISSEMSSISLMFNRADSEFSYPMSKSALNMAVRLLHNDLYKDGYSFRLYQPGPMWHVFPDGTHTTGPNKIDPAFSAAYAAKYFSEKCGDEQRLVLGDYLNHEYPF